MKSVSLNTRAYISKALKALPGNCLPNQRSPYRLSVRGRITYTSFSNIPLDAGFCLFQAAQNSNIKPRKLNAPLVRSSEQCIGCRRIEQLSIRFPSLSYKT